jgi:parallel beta-helix repeat protein
MKKKILFFIVFCIIALSNRLFCSDHCYIYDDFIGSDSVIYSVKCNKDTSYFYKAEVYRDNEKINEVSTESCTPVEGENYCLVKFTDNGLNPSDEHHYYLKVYSKANTEDNPTYEYTGTKEGFYKYKGKISGSPESNITIDNCEDDSGYCNLSISITDSVTVSINNLKIKGTVKISSSSKGTLNITGGSAENLETIVDITDCSYSNYCYYGNTNINIQSANIKNSNIEGDNVNISNSKIESSTIKSKWSCNTNDNEFDNSRLLINFGNGITSIKNNQFTTESTYASESIIEFTEIKTSLKKEINFESNTVPSFIVLSCYGDNGDITFKNNTLGRININSCSNLNFQNNTFSDNQTAPTVYVYGETIKNSQFYNNSFIGIPSQYGNLPEAFSCKKCSNNKIEENNFSNFSHAISLSDNSSNNFVSKNHISSFNNTALSVYESPSNKIEDNNIEGQSEDTGSGISINKSDKCIVHKNKVTKCYYGFELSDTEGVEIYENIFDKSGEIRFSGELTNNKFYNNKINSDSVYISSSAVFEDNQWNIEPVAEENIVGGPSIGGNYWKTNKNCVDNNLDGFCDEPYKIVSGENEIIDQYPLYMPRLIISSGSSNPVNKPWSSSKSNPVKVMHLKFRNNVSNEGDAEITKLTFRYSGEGDVNDIEEVKLYKDKDCVFTGSSVVEIGSSGKFVNNKKSFYINEKVAPEQEICFVLEYKINDEALAKASVVNKSCGDVSASDYCPCAIYGAEISDKIEYDILASLGGNQESVAGEVKGSINASYPDIYFVDEADSKLFVAKKKKLNKPLSVKLDNFVKTDCYKNWKAVYEITKEPAGVIGDFLEGNGETGKKIEVPFNENGIAEAYFTSGDMSGEYNVSVKAEPTNLNPYTCPSETSQSSVVFTIYTGGLHLKPKYDGSEQGENDYIVSTFISTIEAKNKLTVEFDLPPWSAKPKSVTFMPSWAQSVTDTTEPFEAEYDMQNVKENSKLKLVGILEDGTKLEEEYDFYAIELPTWVNTFNGFPYKGITWEFNKDTERYELTFNYPDNFAWDNPIPTDIGVIGHKENEFEYSCFAKAIYYVNQVSGFQGGGEFSGEILENPVSAKGEVHVFFDKEFKITDSPPPGGSMSGEIEFETEKRKIASKTIVIAYVPITLKVEAGSKIKIFASAAMVLTKEFKIKKVTFIPGTTLTLVIDASAAAVFGLAKVGVRTEPSGTLKIQLGYTTAGGMKQEKFGGELAISATLYGSLFWGGLSGDLKTVEYGPWIFGDSVGAASYLKKMIHVSSSSTRFYSTSDSDADSSGNEIIAFTKNTGSDDDPNPEIAVKMKSSGTSAWNEKIITSNSHWEMEPAVTFTKQGKAIILWTSNNGDKSLDNLTEIMNHQNIAYSYFNGSNWSEEKLIINDNKADGTVKAGYDSDSDTVAAVWVHNNSTETITDKTNFDLYYSIFKDENWTEAKSLFGSDNGEAEFMPAVSGTGDGRFIAVWINDKDGKLFKKLDSIKNGTDVDDNNTDCNVLYSVYSVADSSWSEPKSLTSDNGFTELMPDVAVSGEHKAVVVWVEKNGNIDKLYMSQSDSNLQNWSGPELLDEGFYLIEDPKVSIDKDNIAHITYRKHSGNDDGIYEITVSVKTSSVSSKKLTGNPGLWQSSIVTSEGNVLSVSTDVRNSGKLKTGEIDKSNTSSINQDSFSEEKYDNSTGKYAGIKFSANVNIVKAGTYKLKAKLYKENKLIAEAESDKKDLDTGESSLSMVFSGRDISGSKENGAYKIKDVELVMYNPDEVIINSVNSDFSTGAYDYSEFIPPRLNIDKNMYSEKEKILITVYDENINEAIVHVSSTEDDKGADVVLSKVEEGKYQGYFDISGSGLKVEAGGVIKLLYVDSKDEQWFASAGYAGEVKKSFDLKVKVNGAGKVTGLEDGINCPNNCYESVEKGSSVTLTAVEGSASEFIGWETEGDNVTCDNSSMECTFTMDNNTEVTAYFKTSDYIEDSTGDIEETGKNVKRVMSVSKGWQLVSVPVEGSYNTGEKFNESSTVWGWNGSNWEVWSGDENIVALLNQYKITILSKLESGKGYWLNSGDEYTENFEGLSYGKDKINLSDGWSLVGCGIKIKASEFGEAKTVWQWTGSNWKVWSPQNAIITLLNQYKIEIADELKAGEGFWVNK